MRPSAHRHRAFTLIEVMVGIGLAGALVLMILLLGTTAIGTDAKASDRQIASAVAESQLDLLARQVAIKDSAARNTFWQAPDGPYQGPGAQSKITSNGSEYSITYSLQTVRDPAGGTLGGVDNRLRQVFLLVEWWEGDKGRAGFGQLSVRRTRLLRETDVRN